MREGAPRHPRSPGQRTSLLFACAALALLAVAACSAQDVAGNRSLFDACSLNSDCAPKLICALGQCRNPCASSVDCAGGTCVTDGKNAVCESPAEENTPCSSTADCPAPLACAADYRCRNLCDTDADCNVLGVTGRTCAKDGEGVEYCADTAQVDAGAIVAAPPPGAPDAAVIEPSADAALESGEVELPIGSNGGTFGIDGISVTIPPGALDHDITISITPIAAPAAGALGQAFEIGPTGTQFLQPVLITFSYTDAELDGSAASAYAVDTIVDGAWQPVSAPMVDPYTHTISGTSTHLSPYALATSQGSNSTTNSVGGDGSFGTSLRDGGAGDATVTDAATSCVAPASLPLAIELTVPLTWQQTQSYATGNGSAKVWFLSTLGGDTTLSGTLQPCRTVLPDLTYQGADAALVGDRVSLVVPGPDSSTFQVTGLQSGWNDGATFSTNLATTVLGLLANGTYSQANATWPATCTTNCTPAGSFLQNDLSDDDGDTYPGITAVAGNGTANATYTEPPTAAGTGAPLATGVDMALRVAFALSGTRTTDCAHITGNATVTRFDTHVVGCQTQAGACVSAQVAFLDESRPVFQVATSTFQAVQVSPLATCADAVSALP